MTFQILRWMDIPSNENKRIFQPLFELAKSLVGITVNPWDKSARDEMR